MIIRQRDRFEHGIFLFGMGEIKKKQKKKEKKEALYRRTSGFILGIILISSSRAKRGLVEIISIADDAGKN